MTQNEKKGRNLLRHSVTSHGQPVRSVTHSAVCVCVCVCVKRRVARRALLVSVPDIERIKTRSRVCRVLLSLSVELAKHNITLLFFFSLSFPRLRPQRMRRGRAPPCAVMTVACLVDDSVDDQETERTSSVLCSGVGG